MFEWLSRELSAEMTSHNGKTILLLLNFFMGNALVIYVTFYHLLQ
jgi:hypothetical protein